MMRSVNTGALVLSHHEMLSARDKPDGFTCNEAVLLSVRAQKRYVQCRFRLTTSPDVMRLRIPALAVLAEVEQKLWQRRGLERCSSAHDLVTATRSFPSTTHLGPMFDSMSR